MRVVGAGFGRTGTTSLKAALEKLGFGPSYSLSEVFANPEHVGFWEAAGCPTREEMDWEGFLAGYGAAVDWPACSFYEELMEAFPEAPVILTVRDPAPWYESTRSTIYELRRLTTGPLPVRAAFALAGLFAPGVAGTVRLADRLVWEDTPAAPSPRLNEAREMRRRLLSLVALSAVAPTLAVLTGVAATVFLVRRVARSR